MTRQLVENKAKALGLESYVDWLINKLGPVLSSLVLDWISKRQAHAQTFAVDPANNEAALAGFDLSSFLTTLLETYGPQLVEKVVTLLGDRPDPLSQLASVLLKHFGQQLLAELLSVLKSPAGAAALSEFASSPAANKLTVAASAPTGFLHILEVLFNFIMALLKGQKPVVPSGPVVQEA